VKKTLTIIIKFNILCQNAALIVVHITGEGAGVVKDSRCMQTLEALQHCLWLI